MGYFLAAACSCGYQSSTFMHGLGFRYFETGIYYDPAYCDHCGKVEAKDGRRKAPKCRSCKGEMKFYRHDVKQSLADDLSGLPDQSYIEAKKYWHCPSCKREKLVFENRGLWD